MSDSPSSKRLKDSKKKSSPFFSSRKSHPEQREEIPLDEQGRPMLIRERTEMTYHYPTWKNVPFQDHILINIYRVRGLLEDTHSCLCKVKINFALSKEGFLNLRAPTPPEPTNQFTFNEEIILPWNEHTLHNDHKLKISIKSPNRKFKSKKLGSVKIAFDDLDLYSTKRWVNLGDDIYKGEVEMDIKTIRRNKLSDAVTYKPLDRLSVIIIEARNLISGFTTHPYIVLKYGGQEVHTEVVSAGIENPVWTGQIYNFDRDPTQEYVTVEIYDSCLVQDDAVLGSIRIKLKPENDGKVLEGWYHVKDKENNTMGRLHIRFYQFCQTEPKEIEHQGISVFTYHDYLDEMKTGDAVLFSGGAVFSDVIKHIANSPVSHIGYIMKLPDPNRNGKETLFIVESDRIEDGDYHTDSPTDGINFNRLESRIHQYYGNMMLHCPLKEPLTEEQILKLEHYVKGLVDSDAKFDVAQLLGVGMGIHQEEDLTDVFCSEFVAGGLKEIGLIDESINVSNISPIEVANLDIFDSFHNLLRFQILKQKSRHLL